MLNKFFTSGLDFDESQLEIKSRYQMVNLGFILSSLGILYGIFVNIRNDILGFHTIEIPMLFINLVLFFVLRKYNKSFNTVASILTFQFTFLFLFIIYNGNPLDLKHIWIFTYPIILLYYQSFKSAVYWLVFFIFIILIAPIQNVIKIQYSVEQILYLVVVFIVISLTVYFYRLKMDEARALVIEQQNMLKSVNIELANQVQELKIQDQILTTQSKQAVMGEMIRMIAHQWRQPLSTITLHIADYQLKCMLNNKNKKERAIDKTLDEISEMIIYLSETIDDFKTYFDPNKEAQDINIHELLKRTLNLALPRLKGTSIKVVMENEENINVNTYINEIVQVILNILNNAIDVLKSIDKKIDPEIVISYKDLLDSVEVSVKDNANGIDENNIKHLFEPYFSTKGKNGTGLGLYMSQMIMQKHFSTDIKLQTSKDSTIFIIEIPKTIE